MSSWTNSNKSSGGPKINNSVLNSIKNQMFSKPVNLQNYNSGKNGKVYLITQNSNKILKVSKLNSKNNLEAVLSLKAANSNVAPKIYKTAVVQDHLAILQEKMDGTLKHYMETHDFTEENFRSIESLVLELHKAGICHKDLHIKNIMYKMHNGKPVFKIIDFSRAIMKNGPCASNRNKLNQLFRQSKKFTNSSTSSNKAVPIELNFKSENYKTP